MNYYEHHIRDYDAATSHLSWDEDLAYTRLIRWYYRKEQPIPPDIKEACRQVRATTKAQRDAVENVLKEFFVLQDDGWHNKTCDEAVEEFLSGAPEREAKKANEDNRLKKHRDERARLFKTLTDAGEHAPWNIKIEELRALVAAVSADKPATAPATKPATPATAPATPATATQAPSTNTQTPDIKPKEVQAASTHAHEPPPISGDAMTTRAIELATLLRKRGAALQASDPRVIAWAAGGISDAQALTALETAQQRRHEQGNAQPINAGYLDAILKDFLNPPTQAKTGRKSIHDERADTIAQLTGANRNDRTATAERDITGESVRVA